MTCSKRDQTKDQFDAMGTSYEVPATLKLQRQSNVSSGMTARFPTQLYDERGENCAAPLPWQRSYR